MNQAVVSEIQELGESSGGLLLEKDQCILPYLTLTPGDEAASDALLLTGLRTGDVVLLQAHAEEDDVDREEDSIDTRHLAIVTSSTSPTASAPRAKLTLRCSTLGVSDLESASFVVHGLDSEVTALRMAAALRALVQPAALREVGSIQPPLFTHEMRTLLVGSFSPAGRDAARAVAVEAPSKWEGTGPDNDARCVALAVDSAAGRGTPLTPAQVSAVMSALQRRVTLIHGPPGTGKTTAAVCVVHAWRPSGEKILCAADSNVAADHLHASLTKWGIKALRFSMNESDLEQSASFFGDVRLSGSGASKGSGRVRRGARDAFGPRSKERGNNPAYQRQLAMRSAVSEFQVVVTTCGSAGHELLKGVVFPRVLIDECTQSVEPMSLVPMSYGCTRLVLIGDHCQLPPTVITEEARRGGLEKSLFARLVETCAEASGTSSGDGAIVEPLLLDEQRRMHTSIAAFPNAHFYRGRVQDAVPDRPPVFGLPWPRGGEHRVLLVDVSAAADGEEREGTSWRNAAEVQAVLELATHVLHAGGGTDPCAALGPGVPPEEIAVITPYLRQKELLQREFYQWAAGASGSRASSELAKVRVATVDGFQGAECDLVIFSAVRSNRVGRLGFLLDERRANVLLTRARRGGCLCGCCHDATGYWKRVGQVARVG